MYIPRSSRVLRRRTGVSVIGNVRAWVRVDSRNHRVRRVQLVPGTTADSVYVLVPLARYPGITKITVVGDNPDRLSRHATTRSDGTRTERETKKDRRAVFTWLRWLSWRRTRGRTEEEWGEAGRTRGTNRWVAKRSRPRHWYGRGESALWTNSLLRLTRINSGERGVVTSVLLRPRTAAHSHTKLTDQPHSLSSIRP